MSRAISFFAILLLSALAGCAGQRSATSTGWAYDKAGNGSFEGADNMQLAEFGDRVEIPNDNAEPGKMIVYNGSMTLRVREIDSANAQVIRIAEAQGGFMESSSNTYTVVRVPAEKLQSAMDEMALVGKVEYKEVSSSDMTNVYTDLDIRLQNSLKARERYLELLDSAENVEAALKVEVELERLNTQIDLLESQMRQISQDVRYSRISVQLRERTKYGPLGYVFKGLYEGVKWLFVRN